MKIKIILNKIIFILNIYVAIIGFMEYLILVYNIHNLIIKLSQVRFKSNTNYRRNTKYLKNFCKNLENYSLNLQKFREFILYYIILENLYYIYSLDLQNLQKLFQNLQKNYVSLTIIFLLKNHNII